MSKMDYLQKIMILKNQSDALDKLGSIKNAHQAFKSKMIVFFFDASCELSEELDNRDMNSEEMIEWAHTFIENYFKLKSK
jgi:hypothetical protein